VGEEKIHFSLLSNHRGAAFDVLATLQSKAGLAYLARAPGDLKERQE